MGIPCVTLAREPEVQRRLPAECLIVALDVPTLAAAKSLAHTLSGICRWVKVGLELFSAAGPQAVEELQHAGFHVFLDLKLHDIPNTVAGAVRSAAASGARMLTIHTLGGPAMLTAAQEAASSLANGPQLLGVTVLTSMDETQLSAIGVSASTATEVSLLASLAQAAGLSGLVCSAEETASLRRRLGPRVTLVVPGIRPSGAMAGDQKRIATPAAALAAGADYLVVGRPITQAKDPAGAAAAILNEMAEALK
jgi:orotidine-5'-phosphate decarboxylase